MMRGAVSARREAHLNVIVRGPTGQEQEVDATIDTGFSGYLTLPAALTSALSLAYHSQTIAILADGSSVRLSIYEAIVLWQGQARDVLVVEAEGGVLLGTALLHGCRLVVEFVDGGPATASLLP